jgi:HSP20 family protein
MLERRHPVWRDPLAEFDELFGQIGRLLESTVGTSLTGTEMAWAPLADINETDDAYEMEIELPGVGREDVNVEMSEREVVVTGELKEREREGVLRRRTRRTGRFEFRAMLPGEVRADDVSAKLEQGILAISVPKAQAARARHIEISSGGESR